MLATKAILQPTSWLVKVHHNKFRYLHINPIQLYNYTNSCNYGIKIMIYRQIFSNKRFNHVCLSIAVEMNRAPKKGNVEQELLRINIYKYIKRKYI